MQREILFRALTDLNAKIDPFCWINKDDNHFYAEDLTNHYTDEKIVCIEQFTGLTDKNGVKIFDGDVLISPDKSTKYVVSFENGCFVLRHTKLKDIDGSKYLWGTLARTYELDNFKIEVIGNIHDGVNYEWYWNDSKIHG